VGFGLGLTLIEMMDHRVGSTLAATACAVLILTPALSAAKPRPGEPNSAAGSNLIRQTQSDINIESRASRRSRAPPRVSRGAPFEQFLKRFFEQPQFCVPAEKVMALGSGFITDPAGDIVTNDHVVANADKVTVIFQDNSRHTARVVGSLTPDSPAAKAGIRQGDVISVAGGRK